LAIVQQVLGMADIHILHRRELLSIALWKWTEARGARPHPKYNIRYVSRGVLGEEVAKINHEHVWPRKWIIDHLLARRDWPIDEMRDLLDAHGVACIVTTHEHGRLGGASGKGWQRYVHANVDVWDRELRDWVDLRAWAHDVPPEPVVTADEVHDEPEPPAAADHDLLQTLKERAGDRATHLWDLVQWCELENAVAVVGGSRDPEQRVGAYFRIHDTEIEEPTPAVAFVHWNGRISFRLIEEDIPVHVSKLLSVRTVAHPRYAIECRISDGDTLQLAKDLLLIALEKVRADV
jgi:hypothetical protein